MKRGNLAGRTGAFALLLSTLLAGPREARAAVLTVTWTAKAVTNVSQPFGLTVPYNTPVTGYFTFDTNTADTDVSTIRGAYQHAGNAGFRATVLGNTITGSSTPFYEVDLDNNPAIDTFRIYDGPRTVGSQGGQMKLNGVTDSTLKLFVAVTEDVFSNDDLIDPFPLYDFGFLGTPHTFSLENSQGTMLMQIDSVTEVACGDMNGGGVKASDALLLLKATVAGDECLPCRCDADSNGKVSAADALRVLKFAVGQSASLTCSPCL